MSASLLHYRPWHGEFRGSFALIWPIARVSLGMMFRRKLFWIVYALALTIFFMYFFGQYFLAWTQGQAAEQTVPILGVPVNTRNFIDLLQQKLKLNGSAETFQNFFSWQGHMVMILLALAGAILVGNDFHFGSLPFYLSKPLNRWHYLLGKCLAVAVFVNLLTTLPALILFVQYGMLAENWDYFRGEGILFAGIEVPINPLLPGILAYGVVLTVCLSLFLVALAVWLRRSVPLIMAWTTLFVFLRNFASALVDGLHYSPRCRLMDLWNNTFLIGTRCLGLPIDAASQPSVFEAACVLGAACLLCLIYVNLRIRAVEVVA